MRKKVLKKERWKVFREIRKQDDSVRQSGKVKRKSSAKKKKQNKGVLKRFKRFKHIFPSQSSQNALN